MAETAASTEPWAVSRTKATSRGDLRDLFQQAKAIQARHFEVGDHDAGAEGLDFLQTFDAIAGGFGAESPGGDEFGEPVALVFFVLDDQYFFDFHSELGPLGGRAQPAQFCSSGISRHT